MSQTVLSLKTWDFKEQIVSEKCHGVVLVVWLCLFANPLLHVAGISQQFNFFCFLELYPFLRSLVTHMVGCWHHLSYSTCIHIRSLNNIHSLCLYLIFFPLICWEFSYLLSTLRNGFCWVNQEITQLTCSFHFRHPHHGLAARIGMFKPFMPSSQEGGTWVWSVMSPARLRRCSWPTGLIPRCVARWVIDRMSVVHLG